MGGGDLNMKKSWHPLLQKNQERVWQEENRAREERKRIEQKRKEIAEERQLQELQRLQESQGGKPRQERLDWMYTAPGSGAGAVGEQMEQYLLGKRGVEELIKGDENEKLKKGAEQSWGVEAGGGMGANSVVDTKNKILADPLLAIKKQEQRKLEELMSNPIKLKQMKKELDKMNGKKEEKKDKIHRHRRRDEEHRHRHPDRDGHRSEKRSRDRDDEEYRSEKRHRDTRDDSERRHRDRDDDHRSEKRSRDDDRYRSKSRRDEDDRPRPSSSRDQEDRKRDRSPYRPSSRRSPSPVRDRQRDRSPYRRRRSPAINRESTPEQDDDAKATAIQAMLSNAEDLESSRAVRLAALEEKEKVAREKEEQERMRRKGLGGRAGFMKDMQNRILEEGRMTAVR